jgi:hypothetical protein
MNRLTEDLVYQPYNVTLYTQTSVIENARNPVVGVGKYEYFPENAPESFYFYTRYHTKLFVTNNQLSSHDTHARILKAHSHSMSGGSI